MVDIAEYLFSNKTRSVAPQFVADILDRLIWIVDDENGNQILDTRDKWLEGDDPERAHVALLMRETLPLKSLERAIEVLTRVKSRWPQFSRECDEIIEQWREIGRT